MADAPWRIRARKEGRVCRACTAEIAKYDVDRWKAADHLCWNCASPHGFYSPVEAGRLRDQAAAQQINDEDQAEGAWVEPD